jgi:hypothetical protein
MSVAESRLGAVAGGVWVVDEVDFVQYVAISLRASDASRRDNFDMFNMLSRGYSSSVVPFVIRLQ